MPETAAGCISIAIRTSHYDSTGLNVPWYDKRPHRLFASCKTRRIIAVRRTLVRRQVPPMSLEIMRQIIDTIEADVASRPSPFEFEMAYQARIAVDRIKFAIRQADQFGKPCDAMKDAGMQLLDALQRLESLDRRFQARSRISASQNNGNGRDAVADAGRDPQ
jgi:hypothetical protein